MQGWNAFLFGGLVLVSVFGLHGMNNQGLNFRNPSFLWQSNNFDILALHQLSYDPKNMLNKHKIVFAFDSHSDALGIIYCTVSHTYYISFDLKNREWKRKELKDFYDTTRLYDTRIFDICSKHVKETYFKNSYFHVIEFAVSPDHSKAALATLCDMVYVFALKADVSSDKIAKLTNIRFFFE